MCRRAELFDPGRIAAANDAQDAARRVQGAAAARCLREEVERARKDYQLQFNAQATIAIQSFQESNETREALDELLTEEFALLLLIYQDDAFREPRKERRRMLAFGAAGSFNVTLSIGQLARVQRTLRELDPEDLHSLKKLADIKGAPLRALSPDEEPHRASFASQWEMECRKIDITRRDASLGMEPSATILVAAGCVASTTGKPGASIAGGLVVTQIGLWVLTVMDPYLRSSSGAEDV